MLTESNMFTCRNALVIVIASVKPLKYISTGSLFDDGTNNLKNVNTLILLEILGDGDQSFFKTINKSIRSEFMIDHPFADDTVNLGYSRHQSPFAVLS